MEMLDADLRELLALFTSHGVEFLVVGGHAVAFHGYPRFTENLDLLVRAHPDNASRILAALDAFGFGNVGLSRDDFTADDRVIQLGQAPNRVDLLTRLWSIEFDSARTPRVPGTLDGLPVSMLSRADLIVNKRATARPQDLADADALESLAAAEMSQHRGSASTGASTPPAPPPTSAT
jgi:hypothetical protein